MSVITIEDSDRFHQSCLDSTMAGGVILYFQYLTWTATVSTTAIQSLHISLSTSTVMSQTNYVNITTMETMELLYCFPNFFHANCCTTYLSSWEMPSITRNKIGLIRSLVYPPHSHPYLSLHQSEVSMSAQKHCARFTAALWLKDQTLKPLPLLVLTNIC